MTEIFPMLLAPNSDRPLSVTTVTMRSRGLLLRFGGTCPICRPATSASGDDDDFGAGGVGAGLGLGNPALFLGNPRGRRACVLIRPMDTSASACHGVGVDAICTCRMCLVAGGVGHHTWDAV